MTRFFLERPVTLTMAMLACVLFGVLTLLGMDLAFAPDTRQPGLTVLVNYPGVGPTEIDALVTKRLEDAVARLPGVSRIVSVSSEGKSKVHLLYPYDTRLDLATMDVLDALAPVAATFPRDMEKPLVLRYDPSDAPVFIVACAGGNLPALRAWAERTLKPRFERVKGVSEVVVAGGEARELVVAVDRYRAAAHGLALTDVVRAVQNANVELPAGALTTGMRELLVKTAGRFSRLEDMPTVGIGGREEPIPLDRVATVTRVGKARDTIALADDREQVAIYVKKGSKASLVGVTAALREIFRESGPPDGGKATVSFDAAEPLTRAVGQLVEAGVIAALITIAVLLVFLRRLSQTLIVASAIPLSVSVTFTVLGAASIPLDMMTLSGLAVGIGMTVDNAVIVLSSILTAFRESGKAAESAWKGTQRVAVAIFASTLTTTSVFLPVLFLSPEMRLLFGHLAAAIAAALFASLAVALAVVPVLAARVLGRQGADAGPRQPGGILVKWKQGLARAGGLVARIWERFVAAGRRRVWLPVAIALAPLGIGVGLLPGIGREVVAPVEADSLFLYVEFPSGTGLAHTGEVTAEVSRIVRAFPFVKATEARVEKAHAVLTVRLTMDGRAGARERLAERFRGYRQAFVHLGGGGGSGGDGRSVTVDVTAETVEEAQVWAKQGAAAAGRLPGISEVVLLFKEGSPELLVRPDRVKASLLGLSARDVGLEVRGALFGPVATKYLERGREVDVRVRYAGGNRLDPDRLGVLPIAVGDNKTVPLASIASFERTRSGTLIYRKNGKLTASFSARFTGIDLGTAVARIEAALARLTPPAGVSFQPGEEAEELARSSAAGLFAIAVALVLVFMVLAALYESFTLPFVVILTIPAAEGAALAALALTGTPLSVPVYLGMIMLAGLVVNNTIVLVDDARTLASEGMVADEAAHHAVRRRLKPLLITTCTTTLGLLPLLLGGGEGASMYRPLAIVMLAGLTVGLAVSLVVVPGVFGRVCRIAPVRSTATVGRT